MFGVTLKSPLLPVPWRGAEGASPLPAFWGDFASAGAPEKHHLLSFVKLDSLIAAEIMERKSLSFHTSLS